MKHFLEIEISKLVEQTVRPLFIWKTISRENNILFHARIKNFIFTHNDQKQVFNPIQDGLFRGCSWMTFFAPPP